MVLRASMVDHPTILINHLMEPPARITGITRVLFSLLEQLVGLPHFRYVLATTWSSDQLPPALLQSGALEVVTRPFHPSLPKNIMAQMVTVPQLMRKFAAAAELNCNPVGCFWPNWPRVITVHDLYYDVTPQYYPRRHRLWWNIFFPLALRAATRVICVSRSTREDLQHYHSRQFDKTIVVHNAAALEGAVRNRNGLAALPDIEDGAPYAIFVGNISPNKNPTCLAAALKILEQRGRPLTVYHVGRDEVRLLALSVADAGLAYPIKNFGILTDEALVAAYRRARFLISTSTHEGFCLPILEAQSCGTAVICSDIPVLREVAGEAALFFDPNNPTALADCIDRIIDQPDLGRRLSEAGVQNAAQFSWARAARETEAVLKSAILGSQ
ncbi:glycosyltransferase family 1 protein [Bradyrhizobium sp. BR13661]|jgi:glycosyltransferase involved in cell wall biosynthesis|uniref:glycosyltransferase family 4 protein n=1 Tax=Bradyrhizobium sp. BR13661 TaxID=2940622 RepID=UPI0024763500|nr:glycosyltransferase family 1 protein [Bradyrhizobium sp. BR13661]MDH6263552.1 glycosyltransferase involved in cell wall biosynthesis [Bradyrhizobium sp. BR13661]